MVTILVKHTVKNFDAWKPVYDQHGATRKAAGCKGTYVFREADKPNTLFALLNWDTIENARKFATSENLRETMKKAGVEGTPEIHFLNEAAKTTE